MATFTALNIEPDDQVDDEIDNTKEIQIEDALKLYQAALKLHSQGPAAFPEAAEAYTNLYKSEIFRYPEAITEFDRIEANPELELIDHSFAGDLDAGIGGEGGPSTLPQILYLSHKNHGQFILDCVKSRLTHPDSGTEALLDKPSLDYQTTAALKCFTLALVNDQSDTELWRRAARVAATLGSKRISRYCLEAAVEVDDDPTVAEVDPASLEEGFAGEQLKEQLQVLSDDTALSHPIMAPFEKKKMPQYLKKFMDPYPFLPTPSTFVERNSPDIMEVDNVVKPDERFLIVAEEHSWSALGDALWAAVLSPLGLSGTAITLSIPEIQKEVQSPVTIEDRVMEDAITTVESPMAENSEATASTPATTKQDEALTEVVTTITTTTTVPVAEEDASPSVALPTRKRSQSTAGIAETGDEDSGAQKRSKRIRNRDNTMDGSVDPATQFAEQLKNFVEADENVFAFVNSLLARLGVDDLGTFQQLQTALAKTDETDRVEIVANAAARDLRDILRTWDDPKASTFVNANAADILGSSAASANAGLAGFLDASISGPQKFSNIPPFSETDGLAAFVTSVQDNWKPLQDAVYEWLFAILLQYRSTLWSESLKVAVVRLITFVDGDIFARFQQEMEKANREGDSKLPRMEEVAQTLFELHLDIYSRITNPNSIVPHETRVMTKERLDRWADVTADVVNSRKRPSDDELSLRYLWASVFYATMTDNVSREHKVLCWTDMQTLLQEADKATIELQNNAVMSEISVDAAEREVSRLTTMDFFFNLFQTDNSNPVAIIETLEPVLDPGAACQAADTVDDTATGPETVDNTPATLRDMWKFLKSGSTSLRLFLWSRLREAYTSIGYNTKVFSCHLKSIEVIVADLRSDEFVDSPDEPRRHKLLVWLKALDDLLVKALTIALNDAATCFEIIDERHLRSTCAALGQLNRVLHSAAIFDDEIRVGMTQLPTNPAYSHQGSFSSFINKLREMQVRTWALQYAMVKEATNQCRELFPTADNDLADFLAHVHYCLGLRKCCKASNKIFLKMMKVEMIRLKHVDKWEDYLGQVLFDLYGIRLGVGLYLLEDHGCPTEPLDRRTVLNIADQVIILANRMPMKDLLKHELRPTIERMQTAVGQAKSTPQMMHNLRNYTEYMKTSIRPLDMYKAFKGQVQVDSLPVITPESPLADKGWYFLLGMIALTKFRSQKRLGPGAQTDDMRVGATFMRLQLQFSADHWETWYRLAQCFDYELEEEVMWTADKINNHRSDLVRVQRGAIHCYIMALSTSVRTADDSFGTAEKLSEMYFDFAMRLYASSREPFGMEAFYVDEFEKHMSGAQGMYKKPLHEEMSRYRVWKYAATLFRKSLADQPNRWMTHFMLGKCLWKMWFKASEEWDPQVQATKPSMESVIGSFVKAVQTVPKPRDGRQEPILEPHYKLVSIIHKFVVFGAMPAQAGADLLQEQPFACRKGAPVVITEPADWEPFILDSLKHLRNADKQHWHHRMIARVANIVYAEEHPDPNSASVARTEFMESIFTKTMHIQVWKPDAERPGRHCVYMERYVRYMVRLLVYLDDKARLEQLVKRVRKKGNDFQKFPIVWNECCTSYLRLIRRAGQIPANMDEAFRNTDHAEYEDFCERLNSWCADPAVVHPALDALKEAQELKKLNQNQMKPAPIDDLINDAFALLYTQVAKTLPPTESSLALAQVDGESGSRPGMGPMSLNNLVMDMNGTQIPVPVAFAASEPSRSRKTGISRREILKKAEVAVSRIPDIPRPVAPVRSRASEPNLMLGSNVEASTPMARIDSRAGRRETPGDDGRDEENEQDQDEEMEEERQEQEEREEEAEGNGGEDDEGGEVEAQDKKDESSERGSVHDSADDESDLSDPPEVDEGMFPGLVSGDEGGDEEEDDGEEEEEEGEEGSSPQEETL
ncbi:hypothetical protein BGZ60DRAFT_182653 [Tricladium varicosporioides]|nr:hypothetical protein BGZ60DRAFT_182653 [Hymenoscyphus varicosporioides]